ncbi:MAG: tetratricopeptide repeat protein [Rhodospirillaceae bacterium]
MPSGTNLFRQAIQAYESGELDTAKAFGKELVESNQSLGDAFNLLSVIAQDQGQQNEAEKNARSALSTDGANAIYLNTLANALLRQGRTDEAIDCFELARNASPDNPDIIFNLGNALRDAGRFIQAIEAYRKSLALRPGIVPIYNNLAITLKAIGDPEGAATTLIEGLAYTPKSPELRFNLGNALQASGRLTEAESAYRKVVALAPGQADAWVNLGVVLAAQGGKTEAEKCFRKAIVIDIDLVPAYVGLADLADDGSIDAVQHRRTILAMRPDLAGIHSSLLMCMHYSAKVSADDLLEEHLEFGSRHDQAIRHAYEVELGFDPDRALRLGVVSGDFRFHAMAFFALPLFESRPRQDWTLICYSTTIRPDAQTTEFHHIADHWRDVGGLSDSDLVDRIVADKIDILIDLSGHAPNNRLRAFASKPAPLQVAWGDYVNTRGLKTIDILIGDQVHTPEEDAARYVERVVCMPNNYISYKTPEYLPSIAQTPAAQNGFVTFGTFSELTKIQPETVELWAKVLKALPETRFFANSYLLSDKSRQRYLLGLFMDHGINKDRVFVGTGGDHVAFLNQYSMVDIILDTWPYSGGLTTCEALVMGVPIVTLMGDRFCGRHTTAHLHAAGFGDWATADQESFVDAAKHLASDISMLSDLRRHVRKTTLASPLCDTKEYSQAFYHLLRNEWKSLCHQENSRS